MYNHDMTFSSDTYPTPDDPSYFAPISVTQAEAEAGTEVDIRSWSPERVKQAVTSLDAVGYPAADSTKVGFISITQAVDLDAIETAVTANTAKVSYTDASAVTANTAKVSYTDASAVALNTAKLTYPAGDATKMGHISITQAVDLDTIETNAAANTAKISYSTAASDAVALNTAKLTYPAADATKVGHISVTQAVDLDSIETASAANTAKVSYSTAASDAVALNTAKLTYPAGDATKMGHISVTQAVDLDAIETASAANTAKVTYPSADSTKVGFVSVTQAVDLDTMESNIATNNAKTTYPPADGTKVGHISVTQAVDLDAIETAVAAVPSDTATRLAALEAKMQFLPKAFGRFTTADPAVLLGTSYNITSVTRAGAGQYAVVLDTDMTTANYTIVLGYEDSTATIQMVMTSSHATTGFNIGIRDASNALSDASESVSFAVYENNT
tara:strand:- start:3597 stop:4934 length:1338 start_codon:yes stop_codon:yes gene_type:complete